MRKTLLATALALCAADLHAAELDQIQDLAQSQFNKLSKDLGAALSYKALSPAEPLGVTGFDVGVEVTATELSSPEVFETATGGTSISTMAVPKVHLHKGLPANIDVGFLYASVPGSNVTLTGAELRYAFIEGGVALPAVAVRGTWSQLGGVDQLALQTTSAELTISKGFAMFTPYAGIGQVWVNSEPDVAGLDSESFTLGRYYAGANVALGLVSFAIEADTTGETNTLGAKLALRW